MGAGRAARLRGRISSWSYSAICSREIAPGSAGHADALEELCVTMMPPSAPGDFGGQELAAVAGEVLLARR